MCQIVNREAVQKLGIAATITASSELDVNLKVTFHKMCTSAYTILNDRAG